jgi:hypothetical protein
LRRRCRWVWRRLVGSRYTQGPASIHADVLKIHLPYKPCMYHRGSASKNVSCSIENCRNGLSTLWVQLYHLLRYRAVHTATIQFDGGLLGRRPAVGNRASRTENFIALSKTPCTCIAITFSIAFIVTLFEQRICYLSALSAIYCDHSIASCSITRPTRGGTAHSHVNCSVRSSIQVHTSSHSSLSCPLVASTPDHLSRNHQVHARTCVYIVVHPSPKIAFTEEQMARRWDAFHGMVWYA